MKTAEDILKIKETSIVSVGPDATVLEALQTMVDHNIGSVFVKDGDVFVGIYTERDLLQDSVKAGFDPKTAPVRDYMTSRLLFTQHDAPLYKLQDLILGKRIRHLLIMKKGKALGVLSAGDVMKAQMNEMSKDLESVSWDYYENWCWKGKKRK